MRSGLPLKSSERSPRFFARSGSVGVARACVCDLRIGGRFGGGGSGGRLGCFGERCRFGRVRFVSALGVFGRRGRAIFGHAWPQRLVRATAGPPHASAPPENPACESREDANLRARVVLRCPPPVADAVKVSRINVGPRRAPFSRGILHHACIFDLRSSRTHSRCCERNGMLRIRPRVPRHERRAYW